MSVDAGLNKTIQANYLLNLGINQFSTLDFPNALKTLKKASTQLLKEKKYHQYLQAQQLCIAICTEMEKLSEINDIRNELVEVIWNHKSLGTSYARLHYCLGFCFMRQKNYVKAQVQFDQALAEAIKLQKKSEEQKDQKNLLIAKISTCYTFYGFACLYVAEAKIPEAVQELKNMEATIHSLKSPSTEFQRKYLIIQ